MARISAYLEVGSKRTFAGAADWPGWARSGRTEQEALDALSGYASRYAPVAERAGVPFPERIDVEVVERVPGSGATDFGVPDAVPDLDRRPLTALRARRFAGLVVAAWATLDEIAAVSPQTIRKGPRGGGRDRDPILEHVLGAETSYARQLLVRHRVPALGDTAAVAALRADIAAALRAARAPTPPRQEGRPPRPKGWPPRYAARRIAWHVLDHAWELQDKAVPA